MSIRCPRALVALLLLAVVAGCDDKKSGAPAAGGETAAQPAAGTPSSEPGAAPVAPGEGGPAAAGAAADPAKVEEAANTALKIMAVVSSAVRGAKGDCARMGQNLSGVMTVAQKWRDQLAEQYKEPGVKQGVRLQLVEGKFPELRMNIMATRDGLKKCPEQKPDFDQILVEIDESAPGPREP